MTKHKRLTSWLSIVCLVSGCIVFCSPTYAAVALYGQRIVVPADSNSELLAAAADADAALEKMTGQEYSVGNEYSGSGIFLVRADAPQATAEEKAKIKDKNREAFLIHSAGDGVLRVVSKSENGLSHGLYFYLEQLGVRYLFPNDNWTVIPQRKDVTIKLDRVVEPDFPSRDFYGTGGFGPATVADPKLEMKTRWQAWQRRNRFGEEFFLGGHTGEAFNRAHKAILEQHPEYLAKVDGKHVPWSLSAKLNVANPDAVKLYVDWSVERFRKGRAADPNFFAVSTDPADGGGHCNSEECKQIGSGSVSDMVFYVANEVAKAIRKEFPDGWVGQPAYNAHAGVPTIDLEPNIYVKVIPYAFQRTGLTADELIRAWGKKVKRMSIYDYWAITDWAQNQPSFNYLSTPATKLRFWKASNIEGFRGESTFSAGAMGIGWYVASRLMWDVNTDEKAVIEEFYNLAFGPAKAPMKKMLERWATGFQLDPNQLALAYTDLTEARRLAQNNSAVMSRLDDYGKYLHYLRLWYEFQSAPGNSPERIAAARRVLTFMWDIYDSTMVQTPRTTQLMLNRYIPDQELKTEFDYKKKTAPFWKDVKPVTHQQINELLAEGIKAYPVLYQPTFYALNDLKAMTSDVNDAAEWVTAPTRFGGGDFVVVRGAEATPVQLLAGRGTLKARISIFPLGDESKPVQLNVGEGDWVDLPIPQTPGIYQIRIQPMGTFSYLVRAKPQACLTVLGSVEARKAADTTIFYVAPGQKTIALYTPGTNSKIIIEDGDKRPVEVNPGLLKIIPVPAGQDGKVWSVRGYGGNRAQKIVFLNGPRVYGFSRAGMLVPANPVPLSAPPALADTEPEADEDAPADN